jgi:NAD(P)-dependent dehydrogenase (short-subunit alcohol dehydrogenase family)
MAGRLAGRTALVTGGASGIGRACCVRFAKEGAAVVVADCNGDGARETARMVESLGRTAFAIQVDVTDEEAVDAAVAAGAQQLGGLDACVAAAGILSAGPYPGAETAFLDRPASEWLRVLDVNLNGLAYTDRAVARCMVAAGRSGTIVNLASAAAVIPMPNLPEYAVSKAGVHMLTKCLALAMAPHGIRVNAIGPGVVETGMTAAILADETNRARQSEAIPLGRVAQPSEIADTALFLSCDESSYYTGQILFPSGGVLVR